MGEMELGQTVACTSFRQYTQETASTHTYSIVHTEQMY